jgi:hypothetical protein
VRLNPLHTRDASAAHHFNQKTFQSLFGRHLLNINARPIINAGINQFGVATVAGAGVVVCVGGCTGGNVCPCCAGAGPPKLKLLPSGLT